MKKNKILQNYGPAVLSAVLMILAFPPFNMSLLVLVALAPWLGYLRTCTGKEARRSGYVFGAVLFAFQMYWVVPFVSSLLGDVVKGVIPWVIAAFLAGFYYVLAGWLIHRCWQRGWWWLIPIVWAGIEAMRAYMPGLAFPWSNLANPLWIFPFAVQHAAFGTVFLVSAWLIIPNLLLAEWIFSPKDEKLRLPGQHLFRALIVFLALLGGSFARFAQPPAGEKHVFTVGQTGVDMAFSQEHERQEGNWQAVMDLEQMAVNQKSELLILPESVVAGVNQEPPISPMGPNPRVPVLLGGFRNVGGSSYFQSAYAYDGKWQIGDKTRLVVFGEYVPMREYLPFLQGYGISDKDLIGGKTLKTPSINGIKAGPLLCFEGLFPDLVEKHTQQGAQFLAVMSIDDWYYNTPAWDQLWQSTVWRSIESGLPLFRAGTNGKSLATDSRGRVLYEADPRKKIAMRTEIEIPEKSDAFANRFAFVYLCWAVMAGLILVPVWDRFKPKKGNDKVSA